MKTAMQQLKFFISDGLDNYDESVRVSEIWKKLNTLLEAEKEQITSSYHEGFFDGRRWSDKQLGANVDLFYTNGHDYYIQTFKSDE